MEASADIHRRDLETIAERARVVGAICLPASADLNDYILVGIDVLNESLFDHVIHTDKTLSTWISPKRSNQSLYSTAKS